MTWLPHLLTTAALLAGFHALLAASSGHLIHAAWLVFLAMLCDGLDGRLARWLGTTSAFGAHYDSLADLLAFGIAPALIVHHGALSLMHTWGSGWGWMGHLTACGYVISMTLRLARFTSESQDTFYFSGLPSVAAAAVLVGWVWMGEQEGWRGNGWTAGAWLLMLMVSVLMVSPLRYPSFKHVGLLASGGIGLCLLLLMLLHPPLVLFTGFAVYGVVGLMTGRSGQ